MAGSLPQTVSCLCFHYMLHTCRKSTVFRFKFKHFLLFLIYHFSGLIKQQDERLLSLCILFSNIPKTDPHICVDRNSRQTERAPKSPLWSFLYFQFISYPVRQGSAYENVAVLVAGSHSTLAPSAFAMYLTGT